MRLKPLLFLCAILLTVFSCRQANKETDRPAHKISNSSSSPNSRLTGALAEKAMVVSAHPLASQVGVEILKKGGNAIDAAVAVQFALAVVYPVAGNIGGGGFMVYRDTDGKVLSLDFREKAPLKAHRDMYLDNKGDVIPRLSLDGHLAVGVPGTVDGAIKMHERFGSMPFAQLVEPAIKLAKGYPFVSEQSIEYLNKFQKEFSEINKRSSYFQKEGGWAIMDSFKQEDLARTLEHIRDQGRAGFYNGWVADSLLKEMQKGGGFISQKDLDAYSSKWRKVISTPYKEYDIYSMAPPSSGGIALGQMLRILNDYPLSEWDNPHDPRTVHHIVETERRVYADRAKHLGDADFYPVPQVGLLEKSYLNNRMADFNPAKASPTTTITAGNPKGAKQQDKPIKAPESEETTHFSIVDEEGNAVSITTTLNGAFGSKLFVPGTGFLLNNEMDDFSAKPGVPNLYGLVGAEANSIAAEKRMLSSMTPTIIEKNDNLFMVVGSPGGSTIITSVLQTFLNVAEFNLGMQEAVNLPRYHHQWKPDSLYFEERTFTPAIKEKLSDMGHNLAERRPIGRVDAILVRPDGLLEGGADIRGADTALGF